VAGNPRVVGPGTPCEPTVYPPPVHRGAKRLASAFSCALATVLGASSAHAAVDFAPCPKRPGIACGTLTVPLDRTGAVAGTLDLRVHRLAAVFPQ